MTFEPKHILVPVAVAQGDDIALAEHLVDAACDLLRHVPAGVASIELVYVDVPKFIATDAGLAASSYYQAVAELQQANRAAAADALTKLAERAKLTGVRASTDIRDPLEGTGEAIASAARDKSADLIMLWSHGRRGLKRLFLGSVAERVAHVATVPVLILRS